MADDRPHARDPGRAVGYVDEGTAARSSSCTGHRADRTRGRSWAASSPWPGVLLGRPVEARLPVHAGRRPPTATLRAPTELLRGAARRLCELESTSAMCWSGQRPVNLTNDRRASARAPPRVVACAAVSGPYRFATGVASMERSLMSSGLGGTSPLHVRRRAHAPKPCIASTGRWSLISPEVKALTQHTGTTEDSPGLVLDAQRHPLGPPRLGLKIDQHRLPGHRPPGSAPSGRPTLLVPGTATTTSTPSRPPNRAPGPPSAGSGALRVVAGTYLSV